MSALTTELVLVLGSNEDAAAQLDRARAALVACFGGLLAASPVLASPASDRPLAPPYLNQAVVVRALAADRAGLKRELRAIEASLGRVRPARRPGLCPIDIDLLGRWCGSSADIEIWDPKAAAAPYVAPLLAALVDDRAAHASP
jgi:2-amino-4-hydroxy-6-hydroxymethyldihydropteridine diphosphokinase